MKTEEELVADIREQERFLEPLKRKKGLLLQQLRLLNKKIKKHDQTISFLADELVKRVED